jgi:hypothetical protein
MGTITACLWFDGQAAGRVKTAIMGMIKLGLAELRQACGTQA